MIDTRKSAVFVILILETISPPLCKNFGDSVFSPHYKTNKFMQFCDKMYLHAMSFWGHVF